MARKGEIFGFTATQIFVVVVAAGLVAGGIFYVQGDAASVDDETLLDVRGEFEVAGMNPDDFESPFSTISGFDHATVDEDTSDGLSAEVTWNIANGTDLGLQERTAVAVFETDGALANVEATVENVETSGADFNLEGATVYDYERAVEADSLETGKVADLEVGDESVSAEGTFAETSTLEGVPASTVLEGGEYAVALDYKFESGYSVPDTTGTVVGLNNIALEADTMEDDVVEEIDFGVQLETFDGTQ